jgi:hypothetical protein
MTTSLSVALARRLAIHAAGAPDEAPEPDQRRAWWPAVVAMDGQLGVGEGPVDEAAAAVRELGRHAISVPLIEAHLGVWVRANGGRPGPVTAESWATVALGGAQVSLARPGHGAELRGRIPRVPWARAAPLIVVYLHDGFAAVVERSAPGVRVEPGANLADEPRDGVVLDGARCLELLESPPPIISLRQRGALLSLAAMLGAAEGAYELTRQHVLSRRQFDRPLVAFQAVAHHLARMACDIDIGRASFEAALTDADDHVRTAAAKLTLDDVATAVAARAHQLHGARGVTRENPLHRFTRRLWSWRDEWGHRRQWERELGEYAVSGDPGQLWDLITM